MPRFTCIFPCQFQGGLVRRGQVFTATADQLKLPSHSPLLNTASFRQEPEQAAEQTSADGEEAKTAKTTRQALLEKCAALKLTVPAKATNAALTELIAAAANPAGAPADPQ